MNTLAVGMELVSCHAGQTLLAGVALGWILAWLCIALLNELGWPRATPPAAEPVSGSRSVSSSARVSNEPDLAAFTSAVTRQGIANLNEADPIESYPPAPAIAEPRVTTTVRGPIAPMSVAFNPFAPSDATMRNYE